METVYAIELRNITKRFGSVVANDGICLGLRRGEILSLLGENGSGKTTLMNMLAGIYLPDEGEILADGKPISIRSPKDAFDHKIGMIHQHYKLVDVFTAAENIVLGLDEGGRLDIKATNAKVKEICDRYGFDIDPTQKIYDMSVSQKQTVEIRYRTETSTDPETGETTTEEVPYEYYILNVTLTNKTLPAVILPRLNEQQREIYTVMQQLKGNKPYLWEGIYNGGEDTGPSYEIPGEALDDPAFAALMEEATKYIGWPYVWGGSSPSTSFDCSGFVCWVYTASGVHNLPRTTAQGIYNQCAIISPSEAKPGDIIFFTGTYDSPGPVSHVGIYVGDGMMLHCGSPIQYANINSSYWQTHFYAFGRL